MNELIADRPIFVLTVDTEEEWDWSGDFPRAPFSTQNILRIPKFQDFCASIGVFPTYFVDYAVAADTEKRDILKRYFDRGECDIGAHLHPWCTPPVTEEISDSNSHAINLDPALVEDKLVALTELLEKAFGVHPFSFRSGRWGTNGALLAALARLGYKVDSSVRPFYSDSSFSYQQAPTQPYWPSFEHELLSDATQTQLLEIPTSSGFNWPWFEKMNRLHDVLSRSPVNRLRAIGILWRLGMMRKITVTPEGHDAADICRCIDMCIKRGDKVIGMFFHSSDLMPGNTVYVQSEQDELKFYQRIRHCVEHVRTKHNAEFLTIRQTHKKFQS